MQYYKASFYIKADSARDAANKILASLEYHNIGLRHLSIFYGERQDYYFPFEEAQGATPESVQK